MANNDLLSTLFPELMQTERSAERHGAIEAQRLRDTPLGEPLMHVSKHASAALVRLSRLADARGLHGSRIGIRVGRVFSTLRDRVADHLIDAERSYRGTLLGIRHGVDLVRLVAATAEARGDAELQNFCDEWLETRTHLAHQLESRLAWFAHHPERARSNPKNARRATDRIHASEH
jgi:hypothetical protein